MRLGRQEANATKGHAKKRGPAQKWSLWVSVFRQQRLPALSARITGYVGRPVVGGKLYLCALADHL